MTERITVRMLEFQLEQLREKTGINFQISKWSPGDSYGTRHQLVAVHKEHGGERTFGRVFLGVANMYDGLRLLNDVLDSRRGLEEEFMIEGRKKEVMLLFPSPSEADTLNEVRGGETFQ